MTDLEKKQEKMKVYRVLFVRELDKSIGKLSLLMASTNCPFVKSVYKFHIELRISDGLYECHNLYGSCVLTSSIEHFLRDIIEIYESCNKDFVKFIDKYAFIRRQFININYNFL